MFIFFFLLLFFFVFFFFFFFNDTATTEIYTLSLHDALPIRWRSAKVTSRIALATATPIDMIAPMSDSMFNVVPVIHRLIATPATTEGTVSTTASDSRKD